MRGAQQLLNLLYPPRCIFCEEYLDDVLGVCDTCREQLPFVSDRLCSKCGKEECVCSKRHLSFEKVFVPFLYDMGVKEAIIRFKQGSKEGYAQHLAKYMAEKIDSDEREKIDLIMAVPMRRLDEYRRGYNQSELLAQEIGKLVDKTVNCSVLRKKKKTGKQHELSKEERLVNLKGAFTVIDEAGIKEKNILLCDDVLTTGSTLSECARSLLEAGAKSVYGIVLATA